MVRPSTSKSQSVNMKQVLISYRRVLSVTLRSVNQDQIDSFILGTSSLSRRRFPVGLRRRSSSAAFCYIKDVCCETNLQQLWRQVFCSCRSEAVEQLSAELRQADISFQRFKRLLTFLFGCCSCTAEIAAHCD